MILKFSLTLMEHSNYSELEINALNTVWDLFINKPYREKNVVLNDSGHQRFKVGGK
jgi:hypothetical protein